MTFRLWGFTMVSLIKSERRNDNLDQVRKLIEFIENLNVILQKWNSIIDDIIEQINLKIESLTLQQNN